MPIISRCYRSLASPRPAVIVFLLVTMAALAGALMDSDVAKSATPGLSSSLIFRSRWFLLINIVLLIITVLCVFRQFGRCVGQVRKFAQLTGTGRPASSDLPDDVSRILWRKGYTLGLSPDGYLTGWKNRFGFAGAPIFHLGLAVVILGVMTDIFAGFTGYVALRPGKIFSDIHKKYISLEEGPLYPDRHGRFELFLHEVNMEYNRDGVSSSGLVSVIQDGREVKRQIIDRDNNINVGLIAVNRGSYGYYVFYRIIDRGKTIVDHAQGLNTVNTENGTQYTISDYRQPGTPYVLDISYFPDIRQSQRPFKTFSYEPVNPAVELVARYRGTVVYNGLVRVGQEVVMDNGHRFVFRGTAPYLLVRLRWLLGAYIAAAGFVLFLLGLLIYYCLQPSIVRIKRGEEGYEVEFKAWAGREVIERQVREMVRELNFN